MTDGGWNTNVVHVRNHFWSNLFNQFEWPISFLKSVVSFVTIMYFSKRFHQILTYNIKIKTVDFAGKTQLIVFNDELLNMD